APELDRLGLAVGVDGRLVVVRAQVRTGLEDLLVVEQGEHRLALHPAVLAGTAVETHDLAEELRRRGSFRGPKLLVEVFDDREILGLDPRDRGRMGQWRLGWRPGDRDLQGRSISGGLHLKESVAQVRAQDGFALVRLEGLADAVRLDR